jgi:hypothetical protein
LVSTVLTSSSAAAAATAFGVVGVALAASSAALASAASLSRIALGFHCQNELFYSNARPIKSRGIIHPPSPIRKRKRNGNNRKLEFIRQRRL